MTCTIQVLQGATYTQVYRWSVEPWLYKTASAVVSQTPLTLTVNSHGIPDGWSVAIAEFAGLEALQAADWPPTSKDFYQASVIDANTIAFNTVDAARVVDATPTTGTLAILTPVDLTAATAAFNIYPFPAPGAGLPVSSPEPPPTPEMTVTGTVDNTAKTITITLTAANTTDLNPGQYAYALIITQSGVVTVLDQGALFVGVPGVTAAANL